MKMDLGYTRLIVEECRKAGLLRNQAAYVLATAYHETAHTMKPIREMGGEKYLKSKPYYPYVGMGFVQLTWKANYQKASKALGVDFVANPKKLLEPAYSAAILVTGMKEGWFTTKALEDYITLYKSDFTGARRIVNGTDRARLIAGYAVEYDAALKAMGYGEQKPVEPAKTVPAPSPAPEAQTPPAAKPEPKRGILAIIFDIIGRILKGGRP
jgi:hypothetical protein